MLVHLNILLKMYVRAARTTSQECSMTLKVRYRAESISRALNRSNKMATRPTWNTKVLDSINRMMIRLRRMAVSCILCERRENVCV